MGVGGGLVLGKGLPYIARKIFRGKAVEGEELPDKIFSDKDTIDIAKQQTKIDAPISNTTKTAIAFILDKSTID